jgi:hypothetical protein
MPSMADLVSFIGINLKPSRSSRLSFVLLLAAAGVFVLVSARSLGGIDSLGRLPPGMMEGGVIAEADSEKHPIIEFMREGKRK